MINAENRSGQQNGLIGRQSTPKTILQKTSEEHFFIDRVHKEEKCAIPKQIHVDDYELDVDRRVKEGPVIIVGRILPRK